MNLRERLALIATLKQGNETACLAAIETIEKHGGRHTNRLLIKASRVRNLMVRAAAIRAFGKPGNITVLMRLLVHAKTDDLMVLQEAVDAMGRIGHPMIVAHLIEILLDSTSPVRMNAARALGQLKDQRAIPPLIEALRDENWTVVNWTVDALEGYGQAARPELLKLIVTANLAVAEEATRMRRQWAKHQNKPELFDVVVYHDLNANARWKAGSLLAKLGESVLPDLVVLLQDSDRRTQKHALDAIAEMAIPAAIPYLKSMLNDEDYRYRREAIMGLGQIDDPAVVPILLGMVDDTPIQPEVVWMLGRHIDSGDSRVIEALVEFLQPNYRADARGVAIGAMVNGPPDPRILAGLAICLGDPSIGDNDIMTVGEAALKALESIGTADALRAIANWQSMAEQDGEN